jgi:hypothetical protein
LAADDAPPTGRAAGGRASRPDPFSDLLDAETESDTDSESPGSPARPAERRRNDAPAETTVARRGGRRDATPLRARQVQRILRYVAPWSALKVSFFFFVCLWLIILVAGVILWAGASSTGAIDNVESFIEELFGLERFAFEGSQMFRGVLFGGFALVVVGTAFSALIAVLFNLISDLTGGLRLTVVEVERAPVERSRDSAG